MSGLKSRIRLSVVCDIGVVVQDWINAVKKSEAWASGLSGPADAPALKACIIRPTFAGQCQSRNNWIGNIHWSQFQPTLAERIPGKTLLKTGEESIISLKVLTFKKRSTLSDQGAEVTHCYRNGK
jgi:hypothetical protein